MKMYGCENFRTFAAVGSSVNGVLPDGTYVPVASARAGRASWLAQVLAQHQPMKRALQRLIDVAERGDELDVDVRAEIVAEAEKLLCWGPK